MVLLPGTTGGHVAALFEQQLDHPAPSHPSPSHRTPHRPDAIFISSTSGGICRVQIAFLDAALRCRAAYKALRHNTCSPP